MSDNRKKTRRRRSDEEMPELTPLEKSIAKYLRFNCPTKKGILMGVQVVYFNGSKAVECLTESKWSSVNSKALAGETTGESKNPICFSSKHDAVQMIRKFSDYEMFRRVIKVYKEDKPIKDKETESTNAGDTSQSNTPRSVRQRKPKNTATAEVTKKDEEKSKKKKFKFELNEDQVFVDSPNEFYVWIYSPTTVKQYILGALLVIGCIGVCLFPLWPPVVRTGVYYLSMVLASLLGVLLSLAVVKYIIFAAIWIVTMGKIKFWLLPNLTEDVGFFESFVPFYTLTTTTDEKKKDDEKLNTKSTTNEDENNEDQRQTTKIEDEDEDKEKSSSRTSSIDDLDDGQKPTKSSDEDFEVLSKDELENK